MLGAVLMLMIKLKALPLPLLPMILRSLNLATLFFITWELFLSSPQKFSSFPILRFTIVPSSMSLNAITLKAEGRVLFDLQWLGSAVQRTFGEPTKKANFKMRYFRAQSHLCDIWKIFSYTCLDEFSRVFSENLTDLPFRPPPFGWIHPHHLKIVFSSKFQIFDKRIIDCPLHFLIKKVYCCVLKDIIFTCIVLLYFVFSSSHILYFLFVTFSSALHSTGPATIPAIKQMKAAKRNLLRLFRPTPLKKLFFTAKKAKKVPKTE